MKSFGVTIAFCFALVGSPALAVDVESTNLQETQSPKFWRTPDELFWRDGKELFWQAQADLPFFSPNPNSKFWDATPWANQAKESDGAQTFQLDHSALDGPDVFK